MILKNPSGLMLFFILGNKSKMFYNLKVRNSDKYLMLVTLIKIQWIMYLLLL